MSEIQTGTFMPEIKEFNVFEDVLVPLSKQYKQICFEKGLQFNISNQEITSCLKLMSTQQLKYLIIY